jgi:hypothetical protein
MGGALSTASERKSRKGTKDKKKTKNDDDNKATLKKSNSENDLLDEYIAKEKENELLTSSCSLKRLPKNQLEVLYREDTAGGIPRDVMLQYFCDCSLMIMDINNIDEIIQDEKNLKKGLHLAAMEYQRYLSIYLSMYLSIYLSISHTNIIILKRHIRKQLPN